MSKKVFASRVFVFIFVLAFISFRFIAAFASTPLVSKGNYSGVIDLGLINAGKNIIEFDVTPLYDGIDGIISIVDSSAETPYVEVTTNTAAGWSTIPILFRLQPTGFFDARNGSAYSAVNAVSYQQNKKYHVRITANFSAGTYTAEVEGVKVAEDFSFRTGANPIDDFGKLYATSILNNQGYDNMFKVENVIVVGGESAVTPVPVTTPAATATPTEAYADFSTKDEFNAYTDFNNIQGGFCWHNMASYANQWIPMTWNATKEHWQFDTFNIVGANWMHPGLYNDTARVWKAPRAGMVEINGNVKKDDTTGGDGVNVKIMKNSTQLWPSSGWQYINYDDSIGVNYSLSITVAKEDTVYFIVNAAGNNNSDTTVWAPTVVYQAVAPTATPTLVPAATPEPTFTPASATAAPIAETTPMDAEASEASPTTGDTGMIPIVIVLVASTTTVLTVRRRKLR